MSKVTEAGVCLACDSNIAEPNSNSALAMTQKGSGANPEVFDICPLSISSCALNAQALRKKERILREEDFSSPKAKFPTFFNIIIPHEPF